MATMEATTTDSQVYKWFGIQVEKLDIILKQKTCDNAGL